MVDVGSPRELNVSIMMTSVIITDMKMTIISSKRNICGKRTPFRATSIIPLEKTAPIITPSEATIIMVRNDAVRLPTAEPRKLTASLLTPMVRSVTARPAIITSITT